MLMLLSSLVLSFAVHAQVDYPETVKFLLVQLRSEKSRIESAEKYNPDEVASLQNEAAKERQVTINDFTDHFSKVPVYYFIDTDYEKIINKQFSGVVYNADMTKATALPDRDDYLIVYYGKPSEDKRDKADTTTDYVYNNSERLGTGLIFLKPNYKYAHIYIWHLEYHELFTSRKRNKKYFFRSKKYDIEYFPMAEVVQENFNAYVGVIERRGTRQRRK